MKSKMEIRLWFLVWVVSSVLAFATCWSKPAVATGFMPPGPTGFEPTRMMCCRGSAFEGVTIAAQRCPPEAGNWYGVTGKAHAVLRLVIDCMNRGRVPSWAKPLDDDGDGRMTLRDVARLW